jgi:hypothetical protein
MELFKPGETKQECLNSCPTIELCKKIALRGMAARIEAGSVLSPSGAEFVDEITGEKLTAAQYYGVDDMSYEAAELLLEGGRLIEKAGYDLRDILVGEGCDEPREIGPGVFVCTGTKSAKQAIAETYDDVTYHDREH